MNEEEEDYISIDKTSNLEYVLQKIKAISKVNKLS